jgi:hypothetical protein
VKKTIVLFSAAGILVALWVAPAFALMMESELSGADLGQLSDWLPGLERLVSYGGVVYGAHMDAPTFFRGLETMHVFFRGDHEDFNGMLKEYARLGDSLKRYVESKEVQLIVTLHAGRGNVGSTPVGTFARGKDIAFDWQITMTREGTLVPDREKRRYFVSVDLWVGGDVQLDKVEVPLRIGVKSGGEIEDFIAKHKEKQKEVKNEE